MVVPTLSHTSLESNRNDSVEAGHRRLNHLVIADTAALTPLFRCGYEESNHSDFSPVWGIAKGQDPQHSRRHEHKDNLVRLSCSGEKQGFDPGDFARQSH